MKKILLSLAAVAALGATAAPAAAQSWGDRYDHGRYDRHYDSRLNTAYVDGLQWKIENAARERRISWGEAQSLKSELRQVQPLAWRVQTGQARGFEVERLERVVNRIDSAVNRAPHYAYDRYDRRGYR
jgi:hypothetical protein